MQCINDQCGSMTTVVYETRATPSVIYRRRNCLDCKTKYVSIEVLAPVQKIPESARKPKAKKS